MYGWTDESSNPLDSKFCVQKPSFECEEVVSHNPAHFNCGDGTYSSDIFPIRSTQCHNNRDQIFNYKFGWHNEKDTRFPRCFKIAICSSKIFSTNDFVTYCKGLCGDMEQCQMNLAYCPSSFFAPNFPVWDGHVRLGYFSNRTMIQSSYATKPDFICFDRHKCPFIIPTFEINNYSCIHIDKLNFSRLDSIYSIFFSCAGLNQSVNEILCSSPSMVHCLGTNKCILKRHIMDGYPDCYDAFDESLSANSCSLNDKYRFPCTSENKCLSLTLVNDGRNQCIGREDEPSEDVIANDIKNIPFSALCDGRRELFSSTNETDETHCEQWQCVNQYTQCDGIWHCPKGIDEINCPSNFNCPTDHHPCALPKNQTMGCLHINRTEDGIVDCLGATDERTTCRLSYPTANVKRYQCWNDTLCVAYPNRCKQCKKLDGIDELCQQDDSDIPDIIHYFELMRDDYLFKKLPFSHRSSREFSVKQAPSSVHKLKQHRIIETKELESSDRLNLQQVWLCNRGILIYSGKNESAQCLCPPSYYGDRCQYQNQRISLTLQFHTENLEKFDIIEMIITLVDDTGLIHSYEQLTYVPIHDCNTKFNIYLLYRDRPKDMMKNYTIRVDAYDKVNLRYLTHWKLSVQFLFMPVNRMSALLIVPSQHNCRSSCNSTNGKVKPCRCESDQSQPVTISQDKCNCASDSKCVGIVNNRSICLCPLSKMSPRCFLNSICQTNTCLHGGLCVPDRISFTNFRCICQDGFSHERCEEEDVKIDISFTDVTIPHSLLVHFIKALEYDSNSESPMPPRTTLLKKIGLDEDIVTLYMSFPFHLVFVQIENKFYLTILQHNYTHSSIITTEIAQSQYCPHIRELFDQQTINYSILRRVKYYHLPCMKDSNLVCFHDDEMFMCLCTEERHANCFHFDFNMTYNCMNRNDCQNDGQCFQDHPTCPTKTICVCQECSYGAKCQFTTRPFSLSLDAILGYKIRPRLSIRRQSPHVKISIGVATLMLGVTLITGTLSILTFRMKPCQQVGCGIYLLVSSITSILTIIVLNLKLWFLILSQMSYITSRSFLTFGCTSIDVILRSLLDSTDWLHACVTLERLLIVMLGVNFNKTKSKRIAKLLIFIIPLSVTVSVLHDPIHRRLIDDLEEKRTWCQVDFTSNIRIFNSFINIFHFIIPFSIKLISTVSMIINDAKRRALAKKQNTYRENLREQFRQHRYLLISPCILVILAIPHLILSFSFGCMKSSREPTLSLVAYFVPFIAPALTFFIFVLASETYKQEFTKIVRQKWTVIKRRFHSQ